MKSGIFGSVYVPSIKNTIKIAP